MYKVPQAPPATRENGGSLSQECLSPNLLLKITAEI